MAENYQRSDRSGDVIDPAGDGLSATGDGGFELSQLVQAVVVVAGLAIVACGVLFAVRTFGVAYAWFTEPKGFGETFAQWREIVGGKQLAVHVNAETVIPGDAILAVVVIGLGLVVLTHIAVQVATLGGRMVAMGLGEETARVLRRQQLLASAYRPFRAPSTRTTNPADDD